MRVTLQHVALGVCVLLAMPVGDAAGQTPEATQHRYITELKQRNVDYGAGCNGIGVSLPARTVMPGDVTTRWVAGHSACVPGMRLITSCSGEVVGDSRIVGCLVHVAEGESVATPTCDAVTLITPGGRYRPDPALSRMLSEGSESRTQACATAEGYTQGLTVAVAFDVPAGSSTGDLAMLLDIDGSEVPAFLIPAAQLDMAGGAQEPAAPGR